MGCQWEPNSCDAQNWPSVTKMAEFADWVLTMRKQAAVWYLVLSGKYQSLIVEVFWISEVLQEYILWSLANKSPTRSIECSYSQDLSALNKAVRVLMWSYLRCNSQTTDNSISTNNSFRMVVTQLSFFVFTFLYKSTKVWPIFYQVPRPTCWWKWIRELSAKNFNFCVDLLRQGPCLTWKKSLPSANGSGNLTRIC